jgi:hypothetical protein
MKPFQSSVKNIALPRPSRRFARALLFEDWGLKLLALAITLGLWYGVRVQIGEERVEKRLFGVLVRDANNNPIRNNARQAEMASIVVRAPRLVADRLRAEDLSIVIDKSFNGKTQAHLTAPPDLEDKIELLSSNPPLNSLAESTHQ